MKRLFLDFDGVLHPNFSRSADYFCRMPYLTEALKARRGELEVVISSSWRFHLPFEEILGYLPDALRNLVRETTPQVEPGRHQRYREIQAYLDSCGRTTDWRALDDAVAEFPKNCPELIACDGHIGMDDESQRMVRLWLAD